MQNTQARFKPDEVNEMSKVEITEEHRKKVDRIAEKYAVANLRIMDSILTKWMSAVLRIVVLGVALSQYRGSFSAFFSSVQQSVAIGRFESLNYTSLIYPNFEGIFLRYMPLVLEDFHVRYFFIAGSIAFLFASGYASRMFPGFLIYFTLSLPLFGNDPVQAAPFGLLLGLLSAFQVYSCRGSGHAITGMLALFLSTTIMTGVEKGFPSVLDQPHFQGTLEQFHLPQEATQGIGALVASANVLNAVPSHLVVILSPLESYGYSSPFIAVAVFFFFCFMMVPRLFFGICLSFMGLVVALTLAGPYLSAFIDYQEVLLDLGVEYGALQNIGESIAIIDIVHFALFVILVAFLYFTITEPGHIAGRLIGSLGVPLLFRHYVFNTPEYALFTSKLGVDTKPYEPVFDAVAPIVAFVIQTCLGY